MPGKKERGGFRTRLKFSHHLEAEQECWSLTGGHENSVARNQWLTLLNAAERQSSVIIRELIIAFGKKVLTRAISLECWLISWLGQRGCKGYKTVTN